MTNAELTILTLLAERPRHGYEIEQVIEERGMREWTEVGFSSIYYVLKKLERRGLVEGRVEPATRGPARHAYALTPAGEEAVRASALDALSRPRPFRSPLLLGLANLPGLPPDEAVAALAQYHAARAAHLQQVRARRGERPLPPLVDALFDYSTALIEAELAWAERTLARLGGSEGGDHA